jgi:hypothetical protein
MMGEGCAVCAWLSILSPTSGSGREQLFHHEDNEVNEESWKTIFVLFGSSWLDFSCKL